MSRAKILQTIRDALNHTRGEAIGFPKILPFRTQGSLDAEVQLFFNELNRLSANGIEVALEDIKTHLEDLVQDERISKATIWETPLLQRLQIASHLQALGVDIVSPNASKNDVARCDLGVTEVDFVLPETGTIGLYSGKDKPRVVSLLPRVHLAIATPAALRPDLYQVFEEAKNHHYLVLITGPSRTADIELTVTLGVHGPQKLIVWLLREN
ncbi:MAG: LUD domain-containing protein [Thermanaerothrix sp.]|nr:LUD domain-containing protein [Thermanaerothrix sp.]